MEQTWKLYRIPYFYDEVDESYGFKYINDMPVICRLIESNGQVNFVAAIKATDEVHDQLQSYEDVELL